MMHQLYEVWLEEEARGMSAVVPWCVKLINYIAHFSTKEQAEQYAATVKTYREKNGLK